MQEEGEFVVTPLRINEMRDQESSQTRLGAETRGAPARGLCSSSAIRPHHLHPWVGMSHHFFLRRHIGNGYLDLLRFFVNRRRFLRSDCPERVGKSPCGLLTGRPAGPSRGLAQSGHF